MKYIKLFESRSEIRAACRKYGIKNFTINRDGEVDVDDDVYMLNNGLSKIPIKFGRVTGSFFCSQNQLVTLEGAPNYVGGGFWASWNKLTTLEGGPIEVERGFWCDNNKLITLEGSPNRIGGNFYCDNNPIHDIYRLFPDYESYQDSLDYGYLRGTNIDKRRLQEALDELGRWKMPEEIKGYKWI
jgi:hypothetical protein